MTVRSDVLAAALDTSSGFETTTLATVPSGEVWLCKGVLINTGAGATSDSRLVAVRSTGPSAYIAVVTGANLAYSAVPWVVLEEGDSLRWDRTVPAGGFSSVWVSGAKLVI